MLCDLYVDALNKYPKLQDSMFKDHFSDAAGGSIYSPLIWESTRFCLSPGVGDQAARISAAIMLAGCEVGLQFHRSHAVGVFDPRMTRIYRALGWSPEIIGQSGAGRTKILVGLWAFSQDARTQLCEKSRIAPDLSSLWINQAFGVETGQAQSA